MKMQRKLTILTMILCLLLGFSGVSMAASEHLLLMGKPDQTMVLADYLRSEFEVTIANEADLLDPNSELFTAEAMASYDAIFLAELVLSAGTNGSVLVEPGLQEAIKTAVSAGAGFVHIGGWCSYQGGNADWAGMWHGTPIDEILPVNISSSWDTNDDGVNVPRLDDASHPIVAGLDWRGIERFGGYNKVVAAEGATVVMSDPRSKLPLIVTGKYGEGTTLAYTGGLAGGWDEDFIKWVDFPQLWVQIAQFLVN